MFHKLVFLFLSAFCLGLFLFELLFVGLLIKSLLKKQGIPKFFMRRSVMMIHGVVIIGIFCFLYGWFIEPYRLEITHHVIPTEKWSEGRIRVVQISDLHCDYRKRLEDDLVLAVEELNPDIIVFTGDGTNPPHGLKIFQETLAKMDSPLGKYGIKGNWDMNRPQLFNGTGFEEINGRTILIEKDGCRLQLTGLRYDNTGNVWKALHRVPREDFSLFLYHTPDLLGYLADLPVDLYLCGHTHGGQVCIPGYGAVITFSRFGKTYESGQYKVGNFDLYVNRGMGMEGGVAPRIRFWCRPELAVFDIVAAD